jgi:ABC-type branched-subunit amino acid transport system ATPase component
MKTVYTFVPSRDHEYPDHPERPGRLDVLEPLLNSGIPGVEQIEALPATEAQVARVHQPKLIKGVQEVCKQGPGIVDPAPTYVTQTSYQDALLAAGGAIACTRAAIKTNLASSYEVFPVLAERRRQLAGSMSGGQQQMLAIARALMSAPKLLLVDEPSVGLAPILVSHTITKIKELKDKYGLTVLMAEQNFHQAIRIADRGYIIVHGEIVFEGSVAQLEQNELVKSYYLGT